MTAQHIHLDAAGGVAGDMFVASILDALPSLAERVLADAAAPLPPPLRPLLSEGLSGGLAARRFGLDGTPHGKDPSRHDHAHDHGADFRTLSARIRASALHAGTADHAVAILRRLAEVEARMHAIPVEEVHFHELADWDSLLDMVAAGSIAAALQGATWSVSALPRGGGLVRTRHGLLPVPAPATAALLTGFNWRDDGIGGERVTPTGAAILAHLVAVPATEAASGTLIATGTGAGTRELPGIPNLLRALVFESPAENLAISRDVVAAIGFEVDDMTGEEIGIASDRLRAAVGVLDLSLQDRTGKKGRPLTGFRLLVLPSAVDAVIRLCFLETSTLGLRHRLESRSILCRLEERLNGTRRKRSILPDGSERIKVESDELSSLDGLSARRAFKTERERDQ